MKTLRYILHFGLIIVTVILLCFHYSSAQNSFPTPTGPCELDQTGNAAGSGGELRLFELNANGNNYVGWKAPDAIGANVLWTLPDADGGNGNVLTTNGSGSLSWVKRAQTDLSNLKSPTAINTSLVPASDNAIDLGSTTFAWRHGYFKSSVGIGTTSPDNTLHVLKGSAGVVTGNVNAPLVVENSTNCYLNLLAPDASERGVLFGDPLNNSDGGIIYNGSSASNGLQFRTNGNFTRMTIASDGGVGIGTNAPSTKLQIIGGSDASLTLNGFLQLGATTGANVIFDDNEIMARSNGAVSTLFLQNSGGDLNIGGGKVFFDAANSRIGIKTTAPASDVHIKHTNGFITNGLTIEDDFAADLVWSIYSATTGELWLNTDGAHIGSFSGVSGAYTALSDIKYKKDISPMENVLDRVMKLKPSLYHFKKQEQANDPKFIGMIAQEVQPLFPEAVYEHNGKNDGTDDFLTLDYSTFGVIAIKAIQEQQAIITSQEQTISDLKQQVDAQQIQTDKLTEHVAALESAVSQPVSTNGTARFSMTAENLQPVLGQNIPNPFDNSTLIPFRLPKNCKEASLRITETTTGRIVRVIPLICGETQISIEAGQLATGNYTYSLYVDGGFIDTKQMDLVK